jgi:hypothetical protein
LGDQLYFVRMGFWRADARELREFNSMWWWWWGENHLNSPARFSLPFIFPFFLEKNPTNPTKT